MTATTNRGEKTPSPHIQAPSQQMGKRQLHHQIVIVGGGAAGITVAAQLLEKTKNLDIAIIEPSEQHYYQPGWTLVGGGVFKLGQTIRDQQALIPKGVTWLKDRVQHLNPDNNNLLTEAETEIAYDYLIVCPGIQLDWNQIEGLKEALGKGGVTSNYSKDYAPYTWETIQNFKGGTAIFTYPSTPIKCGGAPQKIMYMADDAFKRKSGVGVNTNVMFCTAGGSLFGVPEYARSLEKVVARRGIEVRLKHDLKAIRPDRQEAVFAVAQPDGSVEEVRVHYDMIHVTPPMSAPDFIKHSPLAVQNNAGGWVDVDRDTLQHRRYPNVFSLGDASSLPTSKTAAAIRKQAPALVDNLLAQMQGHPLTASYDGYTCCPLITGYNSTIMAEFGYDNKLDPSFPLDPTQERYSMWLAKTIALPWLYWNRMLRGKPFEADRLKPLNQLLQRDR